MKIYQHAAHFSFLMALTFTMPALADHHEESQPKSATENAQDQRADYRKEIDTRMQKVKEDLQQLEAHSRDMSREARRDFRDLKNNINDKLQNLEDQWQDFSNKTDAQWEQAKIKLDRSWDQFMNTFNQQKEQLIKEK